MVCKNCGADLKPGIKYCLECGNYIEDDDMSVSSASNGMMNGAAMPRQLRTVKRKKKKRIKPVDILIYAGLSIIIIVSIIVIVYTLFFAPQEDVTTDPPIVTGDVTLTIDNCEITLPRYLTYDIQGSTLFVSDNSNYTLSYKNTLDNYNLYSNDLSILTNDLTDNNYEVLSIEKRDVNGVEFIVCEIKVNGRIKYLYLTPFDKYTTMGVIDPYEGGSWEEALSVIADINSSAVIDNVRANTYDYTDDGDLENEQITEETETTTSEMTTTTDTVS